MTKTFDDLCNDILKETLMSPNQQQQNPNQQNPNQQQTTGQQPAQNTAPQNNMDYKKVWDTVSKLAPEHLTQLMTDLTNHLKTATAQPQQQPNAANQQK